MKNQNLKRLLLIILLFLISLYISLPSSFKLDFKIFGKQISQEIQIPQLDFWFFGKKVNPKFELKRGLDIQGGMQVVLQAKMDNIALEDRETALEAAKNIILRRVDLFGVAEPRVQTAQAGENDYRIIVELPGVDDPAAALQLVGQTAQLDFRLQKEQLSPEATQSAAAFLSDFEKTGLSGKQLKKAQVQFNPNSSEPVISLEFDEEGTQLFADITKNHQGGVLAIFIDEFPVAMPRINEPILTGQAQMSGGFDLESAKQLAIQLNAGALPVSINVISQQNIGASLGDQSIKESIKAGVIGLILVMLFMILYYGRQGLIASVALLIYAAITIALYKLLGVVLTLPGIAGLLISIGMAVDSNILVFERIKEELRNGQMEDRAIELGFGKAWESIKDANLATIITALILINPLNARFLNSSGLVRGFGITLLLGVLVGLFTGVVVSRTLMRVFLPILVRKKVK